MNPSCTTTRVTVSQADDFSMLVDATHACVGRLGQLATQKDIEIQNLMAQVKTLTDALNEKEEDLASSVLQDLEAARKRFGEQEDTFRKTLSKIALADKIMPIPGSWPTIHQRNLQVDKIIRDLTELLFKRFMALRVKSKIVTDIVALSKQLSDFKLQARALQAITTCEEEDVERLQGLLLETLE